MAGFGANYPCFQPTGKAGVVIGGLVSANLTANLASGELYADDRLAEQISEVISGTIAMETDDMTDQVASIVYGATVTDGQVIYNKDDVPPMGKLAYYKALRIKGTNSYRCYYYPQARAAIGNDSAQTKGSSITFQTNQTTFTAFPDDATGIWRITKTFDDQASARAWCEQMCNVKAYHTVKVVASGAGAGESVSPEGSIYVEDTKELVITVTGTPTAAYDNGASIMDSLTGGTYTLASVTADHEVIFIF